MRVTMNKQAIVALLRQRLPTLLADAGGIGAGLADVMQRMVAFRNSAVHNYQALQLPIMIAIITTHLVDFLAYTRAIILHDANRKG